MDQATKTRRVVQPPFRRNFRLVLFPLGFCLLRCSSGFGPVSFVVSARVFDRCSNVSEVFIFGFFVFAGWSRAPAGRQAERQTPLKHLAERRMRKV
eukprot:1191706-Prorocentrum_minimum.AAC.6